MTSSLCVDKCLNKLISFKNYAFSYNSYFWANPTIFLNSCFSKYATWVYVLHVILAARSCFLRRAISPKHAPGSSFATFAAILMPIELALCFLPLFLLCCNLVYFYRNSHRSWCTSKLFLSLIISSKRCLRSSWVKAENFGLALTILRISYSTWHTFYWANAKLLLISKARPVRFS